MSRLAIAVAALLSNAALGALTVTGLHCEYLPSPRGLDETKPRLGWVVESPERGQRQTAWRILVASSAAALGEDRGDLWDSGRVEGDATAQVAYAGRPLVSRQACHWKVKAWDRDGVESAWSAPASWTMGLLQPSDWTARWISFPDGSPVHADRARLHLPPARHYRKAFEASKTVVRATIRASALGLVEFHVNDRRAGDEYFAPGWFDYTKRAPTREWDVTELVRAGTNAVGAIVAEGWYAGYVGYGVLVGYGPHKAGRSFYGKTPALLAQLEVEYADGTRETVGTDESWLVSGDGPFREADLIMGEAFDARRDRADWCTPGGAADWRWEGAIPAEANGSAKAPFSDGLGTREVDLGFRAPPRLQAYMAPPVRVLEELPAKSVTETAPGTHIFDLGENFAGVIRLRLAGPAGTRVQIRYGEMLHPDGRLMTENLRKARATDFYILRGDPAGETWTPRFTYHGFQYVELTGLPSKPAAGAVTGLVLHNDTPQAGTFACSDEVLTRFGRNAWRTQRANFIEVPTDCPQRDERLGWMGDAQAYVGTACFNADVAAFFTKWLDDVDEAQRDSGAYPDYCPYPMAHGKPGATHGTAWTDAGIICPWTIWHRYGDTRVIDRHWASMTRFMDWRLKADPALKGVEIGNTWGDWLNVNEPTPIPYVDACYHALSARLMAEMAEATGRKAEAAAYRKRHADLAAVFAKTHLRPDGLPKVASQSAFVLAIEAGLVPKGRDSDYGAGLAARIASNDFRMTTGFLGTKALLPALTAAGRYDLAVRLFQSRRFPSWGYEVEQGATSVWERWDSYTKEHGFNGSSGKQNASMNSFSHYAFGAVMEWAYRSLAGIDAIEPGFRRIAIRPGPPRPGSNPENPPVSWAKAEHRCIRGRIVSDWKLAPDGAFRLDCEIPANTTAVVFLPATDPASVREGGRPLGEVKEIAAAPHPAAPGRVALDVPSGRYSFTSTWKP
jgi:alpha-L-rhamnosidase